MADAPKLDRRLMEQLMFGAGRVRRFTQDSPVLPDVWLQYMNEGVDEAGVRSGREAAADAIPRNGSRRSAARASSAARRRSRETQSAQAAAARDLQPDHRRGHARLRGSRPHRHADDGVVGADAARSRGHRHGHPQRSGVAGSHRQGALRSRASHEGHALESRISAGPALADSHRRSDGARAPQ